VAAGMTIEPELKRNDTIEKYVLRDLFWGFLPHEILWRQKNGMSDAVGYNWVDGIKEHASKLHLNGVDPLWTHNVPQTSEEKLYRMIFTSHFGQQDHLISEIWRPRWTTILDPSARHLTSRPLEDFHK
jgi:asparagine synthase (glutamine-hydrolysing)